MRHHVRKLVQEHDQVRVHYTDRVSGRVRCVHAEYVLGCDGANSIVRTSIGARMDGLKFEQRWLVVDVSTGAELDQWEGVHQVCDPVRAATYMRIGATRYRWEFRLQPAETAADYATITDVVPLIAPWLNDTPVDELELVRVTEYTFRAQLANRWRDRNVFILGDAAHLTPPFIGQGMGAGLRDAMNLAWKLAGVLNQSLPKGVLDTYEQERKPHARTMIRLARGMGWAMTEGGGIGNLIRRPVVPLVQYLPGVGSKIISGRTSALRKSAFVVKTGKPRQLSGTLCPNFVLADGKRLDNVAGDGFLVVTIAAPTEGQRAALGERGAGIIVGQPGSELDRWLRHGRATAAIVRPDRTVMQASRRLSTLGDAIPVFQFAAQRTRPPHRLKGRAPA